MLGGADDHLVDGVARNAAAFERGFEHERGEVIGAGLGERAALAAERRTNWAQAKDARRASVPNSLRR